MITELSVRQPAMQLAKPQGTGELAIDAGNYVGLCQLLTILCGLYHEEVERLDRRNRTMKTHLRLLRRKVRRMESFRPFFSPAVADLILAAPDVHRIHRVEVTVVFFDLRGFTAFAQAAEPEEVVNVLGAFHAEVGRLVHAAGGTIERFTGDGLMVFFNAPAPVENPLGVAVEMALAVRECFQHLAARWRANGYDLDLGIGIARGFATVGFIGFEERKDYGVVGTVTNLAARLCQHARHSQILVAQSVVGALKNQADVEFVGELKLKGFAMPVAVFDVLRARDESAAPDPAKRAGVQSMRAVVRPEYRNGHTTVAP